MIAPVYYPFNIGGPASFEPFDHFVVFERTARQARVRDCRVVYDSGPSRADIDSAWSAAAGKAKEMNAQSFAAHVAGQAFTRYVTRDGCTVEPDAVPEVALVHATPADEIKVTPDVQVVHVAADWILWSDGEVTPAFGALLPPGGSLSADAARLIDLAYGAKDGVIELPGGYTALAQVQEITGRQLIESLGDGLHMLRLEAVTVRWLDGSKSDLFLVVVGEIEGYQRLNGYEFSIFDNLEATEAAVGLTGEPEGKME